MRDIALTLFIGCLLPVVLMRPHVGALLWAWVSIMNPHRLTFGFAHLFPFAAVIAVTTMLATAFSRHRKPFPWGPIPALLVLFMAWMTITSFFAMASPQEIFDTWLRVFKIHLMLLVTLVLIRSREHIDQLVWVIVLSLGFYGVKGGIWTVMKGGAEKVYGPPGGVIGNNNELALALVIVIPLMYYLMGTTTRKLVRYGLIFAIVTCGFSILGSHSRGAFLAIIACAGMLALKSRRPVLLSILGTVGLLAMFTVMPDKWTIRMETMEGPTEDLDWSAASRLHTWQTLWRMALDNPIMGAGFETALPEIFARYGPVPGMLAYSPHSIYFQALGEHGFVGLAIFLTLIVVTWVKASQIARLCRQTPGFEWGDLLMRMVQVSLVGFMAGGTFLNLLHFDLPYYLMGFVVMLEVTMKEQLNVGAARPTHPPTPPGDRTEIRTGRPSPALRRRA